MWDAATTVGFFTVVNHGVSKTTIDSAFASSSALFARDLDDKRQEMPFAPQLNSGYEFMSQVRPSSGTADQKESLQITARTGCMDGRWPSAPKTLEPVARSLLDASHALASRILSLLEPRACPSVKPGTLAGSHRLWSDDGQCTLRLLHYPPTAPLDDPSTPGPQLWRAAAHTDWCCVTLLYQLPGNEGLECAANPRVGAAHTGWLTVDPLEGGIAVNIGDMLSRWSDGRLLSNLHRVRMPTAAECNPPKSRYSIAFFMQADKSAVIASETNETITAGEYILGRIKSNFAQTFTSANSAQTGGASSESISEQICEEVSEEQQGADDTDEKQGAAASDREQQEGAAAKRRRKEGGDSASQALPISSMVSSQPPPAGYTPYVPTPLYGSDLIRSLDASLMASPIVCTQPEPWALVKSAFSSSSLTVHFVTDVEHETVKAICDEWKAAVAAGSMPPATAVFGVGGGSALDFAKFASRVLGAPLILCPSILSVDAGYTVAAGVRVRAPAAPTLHTSDVAHSVPLRALYGALECACRI